MAASGSERFEAVKGEFEQVLGERLTVLGTTVRAARAILDGVSGRSHEDLTQKEYMQLADQLSELLETLR